MKYRLTVLFDVLLALAALLFFCAAAASLLLIPALGVQYLWNTISVPCWDLQPIDLFWAWILAAAFFTFLCAIKD